MADLTLLQQESGQASDATPTTTRTYVLPSLPLGTIILGAGMLGVATYGHTLNASHLSFSSNSGALVFHSAGDHFWYAIVTGGTLPAGKIVTFEANITGAITPQNYTWCYGLWRIDNSDLSVLGGFGPSNPFISGSDIVVPYAPFTSSDPTYGAFVFQAVDFYFNQGASGLGDSPDGSWTWEFAVGTAGDGTAYISIPSLVVDGYADQFFRVGWQNIGPLGVTDGTGDTAPRFAGAGHAMGGHAEGIAFRYLVLTPPPPSPNHWPANLETRYRQYYRVEANEGNIRLKRADGPAPPYTLTTSVTVAGTDSLPSLCEDFGRRLWLLFARDGDVYETYSDADGENWSTPIVAFAGGSFSQQTVNPHSGARFKAALVGTALKCVWYSRGGTTIAEFTATDEATGDPLVLDAGDGFAIDYAYEGPERLLGLFHIDGETELSDWQSASDGQTWSRIT